jgi:hypothetical protein
MTIAGNPKQLARNIAEGYAPFTRATCRQHTSSELKTVYRNLELVARELRGLVIPLEDIKKLQHRNQALQRANTALTIIRYYAKRHKMVL